MSFRRRPSSKRSTQQQDRSYAELPVPKSFIQNVHNDGLSIRTLSSKLDQLESNFYSLSENNRRERQISNASFIEIQKRIDLLEYKTFSVEKDVKQALDIKAIQNYTMGSPNSQNGENSIGKNDFNMLKQALLQERQSHKEFASHQSSLYQQISVRQMKMEAELRDMLNQQKQEYDFILRGQSQELRSLQHMKERKLDQQYEMMKGVISQAERKIYDELERKIRNESVIKEFVEERLGQLRNQIASEQKTVLTAETKFIREAKQSMESLYSIVQNVKNELAEELSETQKLSATNIKSNLFSDSGLSMSIDIVKDNLTDRLNALQQGQQSVESEIIEFRTFITNKLEENRQMMMDLQEAQLERADREGPNNESHVSGLENGPSSQKIVALQKDVSQWKSITQQKNLNVFKEISNTLKSMRLEWKKENDEMTSELFSLKESVTSVKKSVPNEIKKSVQTIITIFNNQFDVLAEELDLITEMVNLSKRENQKIVKEEGKRVREEVLTEVRAMIEKKHKESTLYSEKAVARSEEQARGNLEKESKYILDMLTQKQANLEGEVSKAASSARKANLNTTAQLEDFTMKLKTFNENYKDYLEEQRKEDMKKRLELQEAMRKNANNLMDLAYKKSQFLVEGMKKAMEMNQLKDKVQLDQKVEILKDEAQRNSLAARNEFRAEMKQLTDKLATERQSSEEVMHEAMEQAVNNAKKSLSIQMNNMKLELEEKIAEGKQDDTEKVEEAINGLRENIWKLQAKNFSQEAKNKAIFDRMGEDINEMNQSLALLIKEIKQEEDGKDQN